MQKILLFVGELTIRIPVKEIYSGKNHTFSISKKRERQREKGRWKVRKEEGKEQEGRRKEKGKKRKGWTVHTDLMVVICTFPKG